ncbi:MAG: isochorismate synthase [Planctomycetes bacterium]|nr:isochorismate synthase [Planctomycetota bacterium]
MPLNATARAAVTDALALARLQRDGRAYAVIAWPTTLPVDPSVTFAAADGRGRTLLWSGDEWQLGLGAAWELASDGPGRGAHLGQEHARLEARTVARVHGDAAGAPSLPACLTAFSFEERPPTASHWGAHLPGARLWLPRRLLWRRTDGSGWTIAAVPVQRNDQVEELAAALLADPTPQTAVANTVWPTLGGNYREEVEDAVALIRDGALRKVVLARAVDHPLPPGLGLDRIIARLRALGDRSTLYAHDLPGAGVFCGVTPELLFQAEGRTVTTMALAGTTRRGRNADEDAGLVKDLVAGTKERKEHGVVVEHLVAVLRERASPFLVPSSPHPRLLERLIHLESVITADLARTDYIELLDALHPTPATCGLPSATATHYIARREKLHRGLYAGAIGWLTPTAARVVVPLRGGLVRTDLGMARLFAGAGIIETSVPDQEFAETELKFSVMRQVLG